MNEHSVDLYHRLKAGKKIINYSRINRVLILNIIAALIFLLQLVLPILVYLEIIKLPREDSSDIFVVSILFFINSIGFLFSLTLFTYFAVKSLLLYFSITNKYRWLTLTIIGIDFLGHLIGLIGFITTTINTYDASNTRNYLFYGLCIITLAIFSITLLHLLAFKDALHTYPAPTILQNGFHALNYIPQDAKGMLILYKKYLKKQYSENENAVERELTKFFEEYDFNSARILVNGPEICGFYFADLKQNTLFKICVKSDANSAFYSFLLINDFEFNANKKKLLIAFIDKGYAAPLTVLHNTHWSIRDQTVDEYEFSK